DCSEPIASTPSQSPAATASLSWADTPIDRPGSGSPVPACGDLARMSSEARPVTRLLSALALFVFVAALPAAQPKADPKPDPFAVNKSLGRGINFGNALEAPKEGEWGIKLEAEYFKLIKEAGFATVRVPVKWSAHAAKDAPYAIDADFFKRIDWVLDQAEAN